MESDHDSNNHEQEQWGESSSSRRRKSRFQAREDETLYEVVAIIAEKKRNFKVRWVGFNPDTGKPWDNSWIPKADVTDDLVENWEDLSEEERRAMNEHEETVDKALKKPRPRKSPTKLVSKRRASTAMISGTLSTKTRRGRRQFGESISGQDAVAPKQEREPSVKRGKKRAYNDEDTDYSDLLEPDSISKSPARRTNKKLKTAHTIQGEEPSLSPFEVSPPPAPAKKKSATARAIVETPRDVSPPVSEDSEGEVAAVIRSPTAKKKGGQSTKTKQYRKPTVAKSNRYNEFRPTESAENEDQESSPEIESPKSRPKHSIASLESKEFVESEGERYVQSAALPQSSSPRRDGEPRKRLEPSIKTLSRPKTKAQKKYIESETVGPPKRKSKTGTTKAVAELEAACKGKPPARTNSSNNGKATPRTNRESVSRNMKISPVLGSDVARRLEEFDAYWEPLLEDQGSESASVRPASFAYGQSDVATDAVDIMYPPEDGGHGEEQEQQQEEVSETHSQPRLEERPRSPLVTPSRVSLVSRMKPKTPRSTFTLEDPFDSQQNDIPPRTRSKTQKTLHPLPVLSPSKFTSHLPPSSFNGSTIENPDDSQAQPAGSAEQIEEFESPEKRGRPRVIMAPLQSKTTLKRKGALDTLFTPAESTVEARGKELAEQARSARLKETGIAQPPSHATLDDIWRARASSLAKSISRSRSRASKSRSPAPISPPRPQHQADDEMDGLEYVEECGANMPIITLDGSGEGVQVENEDTQKDDDERPHEVVGPVVRAIPEEEEESTQDLFHETEVHRAMSELGSPSPEPAQQDAEDVYMVPQPGTQQHPDRDQSPEIGIVPPLRVKFRDLLARHRPEEDSQDVPPTASANQSSSQATTSSLDSNGPKDIKAALSLLNMKSQEINHLEKLLAEEKAKVGGLSIQVASLTKDSADLEIQSRDFKEKASRSDSELAKIASAYDTDRTRWAQEKADMEHALREATRQREGLVEVYALQTNAVKESELAFAVERAKWEDEKYHLELAIKGANDRKALAERDCAYFRDGYMKSSATVGQLFGEKRELEKELGIAKKQASDGVAGIRALFGNQVAVLTKALEHERKVSAGILGLDRRVNDEVRRKAAEEPEMRAKYHKYRDKVQELKGEIAVKDDELHNLEQDLAAAQRENEDIRAQLEVASLVFSFFVIIL